EDLKLRQSSTTISIGQEANYRQMNLEKKADLHTDEEKILWRHRYLKQESKDTGSNADKLLDAIQHMNLEDQKRYRSDINYKLFVDGLVNRELNEAQREAARHMLDNVWPLGKYPAPDLPDKVNIEAGKKNTDERQVVRWLEEEFRKDSTLRKRVTNPETPQDKEFARRLNEALHRALQPEKDYDEYEKWARPVLENGRLTAEQKFEFDKDYGDQKEVFKDITDLANDPSLADERKKLSGDANYRDS